MVLQELSTEDVQLTQKNICDLYFSYWKDLYAWEKILDNVDDDTSKRLENLLEPLYQIVHTNMRILINSAGIIPEEKDYEALRKEAEENIIGYVLQCHKEGQDICKMVW